MVFVLDTANFIYEEYQYCINKGQTVCIFKNLHSTLFYWLMFKMELESKSPQKDILKCFLCSGFYEDPKTLPCLHRFCKKCLLKNIQNKQPTFQINVQFVKKLLMKHRKIYIIMSCCKTGWSFSEIGLKIW